MAALQALISLIGRSAGKILNSIFGWAVVALFGRTSSTRQTLLSGLVAAAAAWPLLLVGIAFPKLAAFVIAFVPLSRNVPSLLLRLVWLGLALAVPFIIGIVIAARAPPGTPREAFITRLLRGYPITMGIAVAFVLMFITVPVLRLASAMRGRKDEHVPCVTHAEGYHVVASAIDLILDRHQLGARRAEPSWWLSGPSRVLQKLGGKALRGFIPERLAYWRGPRLEIALYPSDILIRGKNKQTAWTHGLLAEALVQTPGLQTLDPVAQEVELEIRRIWEVYGRNPAAHTRSRALLSRLRDVSKELGELKVEYDEWQVLYSQAIQLSRALEGDPPFLQSHAASVEGKMENDSKGIAVAPSRPLAALPTGKLVRQFIEQSGQLAKREIELASAELCANIKREIQMVKLLTVAIASAVTALNMVLVAIIFALAPGVPGWASALIVAAVMLSIGTVVGIAGSDRRVKKPLENTQKTLKENVQWAKEQLA